MFIYTYISGLNLFTSIMLFSQTNEETTLEPVDNPENIEEAEPDMGIQITEGI